MPKVGICSKCEQSGVVFKNRNTGRPVCRRCRDFFSYLNKKGWKDCSFCGKHKRVAIIVESKPACQSCYRLKFAARKPCESCGKERPLLSKYEGRKLCSTCRSIIRMSDPKFFEICTSCRISKPVATRTVEGYSICHNCYFKGYDG
jgi:hypothetical protein